MLIKYEFLKTIRKKSTIIIMLISLLVTAFFFGMPVIQYQTYNQEGVIKGKEGIAYEKEQYKDLSVMLTEEYVTDTIKEYQNLFKNPDNVGFDGNEKFLIGDAYWNFAAPRTNLLNMIAANYDMPGENSGYDKLLESDLENGANFYKTREEKVNTILNMPSRNLSQQQKDYWQDCANKINIPFQYGYYEGWNIIIDSFELLMFALLGILIVLAPIFAGEYQAKTDSVILSAKYGKTKLITAKIISSFLFGFIAFTLHAIIAFGIPLIAFGADGYNLPVQIAGTAVPEAITFSQAAFLNLGIIYLLLFAMIGLTLFLSAKVKSPYMVLLILVPILFVPLFLSPNGTEGIYNKIVFLLPYRATMPEIGKYISYQMGSIVLNIRSARAIIYTILIIITLPFARKNFKAHQV